MVPCSEHLDHDLGELKLVLLGRRLAVAPGVWPGARARSLPGASGHGGARRGAQRLRRAARRLQRRRAGHLPRPGGGGGGGGR